MAKMNLRKPLSLLLKAVVAIFATAGVMISAGAGSGSFMGGTHVFMYFTIQSNIAIAIVCIIGAALLISKKQIPNWWYVIKFVGTMAITVTGAVFCFVLAPTMGPGAWMINNVFTHVIVPIAAIVDFFVVGIDSNIKKKSIVFTTIPPIIYAIYAAICFVCNIQFASGANYPYFFLNWGSPAGAFGFCNELPFMGCVWWMVLLLVLLVLISLVYLLILDLFKKLIRK